MKVELGNQGNFLVDGQSFDLSTLMMMLNIDRTQLIDKQIADQMSAVKGRNDKLRQLNDLMSFMRTAKAEGRDDDGALNTWTKDGKNKGSGTLQIQGTDGVARTIDGWMDHFGLTKTDVQWDADDKKRDSQWDANIESVKGFVDSLNSDSQLDMIRLQSLIDKRNQAFELTSNQLSAEKKVKDTIIGNSR